MDPGIRIVKTVNSNLLATDFKSDLNSFKNKLCYKIVTKLDVTSYPLILRVFGHHNI